jgi:hypothetical protein
LNKNKLNLWKFKHFPSTTHWLSWANFLLADFIAEKKQKMNGHKSVHGLLVNTICFAAKQWLKTEIRIPFDRDPDKWEVHLTRDIESLMEGMGAATGFLALQNIRAESIQGYDNTLKEPLKTLLSTTRQCKKSKKKRE